MADREARKFGSKGSNGSKDSVARVLASLIDVFGVVV